MNLQPAKYKSAIPDGSRIFVVEDEYVLAFDLETGLRTCGAIVIGPEPTVERALARVANEQRIDAAVLDVSLLDGQSFPVADALAAKNIPFLFLTGYDAHMVHERFPGVVAFEKPIDMPVIIGALQVLVRSL